MSTRALTQAECKSERIIDLVARFDGGAVLKAADIAEVYGISLRSAQRLIAATEKFVPLDIVGPECRPRYRKWRAS